MTGASYGVGAATALSFAQDGFDVAVTATNTKNLDETMDKLAATGVRTLALALDLNEPSAAETVVRDAAREFDGLDILVNNAATIIRKAAVDVTRDEWDQVLGTNLTGTYFMTTAFGRRLIELGRPGCIVNVASTHGMVGGSHQSLYGISKGGVIQMTRMLAIEWADSGIRVNAVAPGRLDTPSPARAATAADPDYMAAMLKRIPLHRISTADEVAAAIRYLAGTHADSVTGHILVIDGGATAA